jgi:D-alanyl-D-alanine dipeptidase
MGNNFGEISDMNETGYFENKKSSDIQSNRRLLYNVMTSAGFVNTSYRWWEYSYGDVVWAAKNGMSQLYGSAEKLIKGDMIRECKIINKGEQESLR